MVGGEGGSGEGSPQAGCCPSCGKVPPQGSVFCNGCGMRLVGPQEWPVSESLVMSGDIAYLAYRRWPFATMSMVTRTREQWRMDIFLSAIFTGFVCFMLVLDGSYLASVIIAISVVCFAFAVWHMGRLGATGLFVNTQDDDSDHPRDDPLVSLHGVRKV